MLGFLVSIFIGCIDALPCAIAAEGSIVVNGAPSPTPAPRVRTNPTWICPDGTSNPPNLC